MKGQIELLDYLKSIEQPKSKFSCSDCCCKDCLYWWSSRCPYGICWDDHRAEGQKINDYACEHMTDSGCEKMFAAKSLILDAIMEGEDIEPCTEQCCIGCNKVCGYRCGQGIAKRK